MLKILKKKFALETIFARLGRTIARNVSIDRIFRRNIFLHIFFAALIFGAGVGKIICDLTYTFRHFSQRLDLWIGVVRSVEILIFVSTIVAITAENITEERKIKEKLKIVDAIRESIGEDTEVTPAVIYLFSYSFLVSVSLLQQILVKNDRNLPRFFLFIVEQFFLLDAKLRYVKTVQLIKKYFQILNAKLETRLTQPTSSARVWACSKPGSSIGLKFSNTNNFLHII